jgi:hypothetical protein
MACGENFDVSQPNEVQIDPEGFWRPKFQFWPFSIV